MGNLTAEQKSLVIKCNEHLLANEEIMANWKIRLYSNEEYKNKHLIYDGIVDYYKFYSSAKRLLFILRESNNSQGWIENEYSFLLGQCPNMSYIIQTSEPDHKTYGPIAKWANIIFSNGQNEEELTSCSNILKNVAIMNLSKLPGGSSTRETGNRYKKIAKENIDLLKKQFENIQPTVIVCCGDMDDYKIIDDFTGYSSIQCKNNSIPNLSSRTFTVRSNADKTFFFFPHPANPEGLNKFYEAELIKYMQSINK